MKSEAKIQLPKLNLPEITPKLSEQKEGVCIWDEIRKKNLILTPEEWVRQHWVSFLTKELNFPKGLISLEKGLVYNKLQKRTDILVLDRHGKPYLLIECKAPEIPISQKTMMQAAVYHQELKSEFLILSNGIKHVSLRWDFQKKSFEQIKKFPVSPE